MRLLILAVGICWCSASRDDLRAKILTNLGEVQAAVDFTDPDADPFPALWFDTKIDKGRDCYAIFDGADSERYQLKSLSSSELIAQTSGTAVLTHVGACGVCSTLQDLAVYIDTPDLTNPVRRCGLRGYAFMSVMQCLRNLGFTEACAAIWYWNVQHTGKPEALGGCMGICLVHVWTPNNVESGTHNPCKPIGGSTAYPPSAGVSSDQCAADFAASSSGSSGSTDVRGARGGVGGGGGLLGGIGGGIGSLGGFLGLRQPQPDDPGSCGNTINGAPACSEPQWRDGPYRLNPCLQCDECRSGPVFQKVAGRTRRASGLESAIARPPEDVVTRVGAAHDFYP